MRNSPQTTSNSSISSSLTFDGQHTQLYTRDDASIVYGKSSSSNKRSTLKGTEMPGKANKEKKRSDQVMRDCVMKLVQMDAAFAEASLEMQRRMDEIKSQFEAKRAAHLEARESELMCLVAKADGVREELHRHADEAARNGLAIPVNDTRAALMLSEEKRFKTTGGRWHGATSRSDSRDTQSAAGPAKPAGGVAVVPPKAPRKLNPSYEARTPVSTPPSNPNPNALLSVQAQLNANAKNGKMNSSIPPINVEGINPKRTADLLAANAIKFRIESTNSTREAFRIRCYDIEGYRQCIEALKSLDAKFFTYTPKSLKPSSFLIRGLAGGYDLDDVASDILGHNVPGLTDLKVAQFQTRFSREKGIPSNIYSINVGPSTDLKALTSIKVIQHHTVRFETVKKQDVIQCHNCQSFGHVAYNCWKNPVCVRCAGAHSSKECHLIGTEDSAAQLRCALCQGNHTSSYRRCTGRADYISKRTKQVINNNSTRATQPKKGRGFSEVDSPPLISRDPLKRSYSKALQAAASGDQRVGQPPQQPSRGPSTSSRPSRATSRSTNKQRVSIEAPPRPSGGQSKKPQANDNADPIDRSSGPSGELAFFIGETTKRLGVNPFALIPKLRLFMSKFSTFRNEQQKDQALLNFISDLARDGY